MAKIYAGLLAGLGLLPVQPPEAGQGVNANVKVHTQVITLASQPTTDTLVVAKIPAGQKFLYGMLNTDTSLGSATIAIGTAAAAGKYRAAAVFTATNTPTLFGVEAAADDAPLTADEEVIITIAAAALPASGGLVVSMFCSSPN